MDFSKEYKKSFTCSESEPLQLLLNDLYKYESQSLKFHHRNRINLIWDIINNLKRKNILTQFESAIDIGCNVGVYAKMISDFGFKKVVGIDVSLIDIAKRNYEMDKPGKKIVFYEKFAEEINREDRFDFILCTEVIEHTGNPKKVIENIKQILNPGGIAIITLPNAISLPYFLTRLSYKAQFKKMNEDLKNHLDYPFYKTIRLFSEKPIRIIKISGTNLFHWHFLHKFPFFFLLNKINYTFSKLPLLKYFTQTFLLVLKKEK